MAELADALASGASSRKGVEVRVLYRAPSFQAFVGMIFGDAHRTSKRTPLAGLGYRIKELTQTRFRVALTLMNIAVSITPLPPLRLCICHIQEDLDLQGTGDPIEILSAAGFSSSDSRRGLLVAAWQRGITTSTSRTHSHFLKQAKNVERSSEHEAQVALGAVGLRIGFETKEDANLRNRESPFHPQSERMVKIIGPAANLLRKVLILAVCDIEIENLIRRN